MNDVDREFLEDMLRYAETSVRLLGRMDAGELLGDERTYLAVWQAIQIVGEAANQVSRDARSELVDVPWPEVIGMRHRLVHGYRKVRAEFLVQAIRNEIPVLISSLRRALENKPQ